MRNYVPYSCLSWPRLPLKIGFESQCDVFPVKMKVNNNMFYYITLTVVFKSSSIHLHSKSKFDHECCSFSFFTYKENTISPTFILEFVFIKDAVAIATTSSVTPFPTDMFCLLMPCCFWAIKQFANSLWQRCHCKQLKRESWESTTSKMTDCLVEFQAFSISPPNFINLSNTWRPASTSLLCQPVEKFILRVY